jgi:aryl-alcohol dehydrogenase-like predicted oxidoreductase
VTRRPLGDTGLRVPRVILGCGSFGGIGSARAHWGGGSEQADAFRLMDAAHELGIDCFDTADAYGGGLSERFIGQWLRTKGSSARDRILMATKVGQPVGSGPKDRGLSRAHLMSQLEASLRNLGVDCVDMYLIHHPDPRTPLEETLSALDEAVRAGKVRHVGACNIRASLMTKALRLSATHGWPRFAWAQNAYNLIQREDEREFLALVADQRLGYTPHSPLAGGWLTGKYAPGAAYPEHSRMGQRPDLYRQFVDDSLHARLGALAEYAEQRGCSMGALAIAWLLSHPDVTAPIVGPRRVEHLDIVAEALSLRISDDERRTIGDLMTDEDRRQR